VHPAYTPVRIMSPCLFTIRYDTIRYSVFTYAQKLTNSELNLLYRTKQKESEQTKNKNQDTRKKCSSHKVRGVSPEAGSLWWERFMKEVGLDPGVKERELWMVTVVS